MPVVYDDSVLWLWPRNLNTDAQVHDLAIALGREYLVPSAGARGSRSRLLPLRQCAVVPADEDEVAESLGDPMDRAEQALLGLIASRIDRAAIDRLERDRRQFRAGRRVRVRRGVCRRDPRPRACRSG